MTRAQDVTSCTFFSLCVRAGWPAGCGGGGTRTNEVGVIRPEFVVQLDGVRLVDGVPQRLPARDDGVDVFRVGGPGGRQVTGMSVLFPLGGRPGEGRNNAPA
jgi:hypothetical protein